MESHADGTNSPLFVYEWVEELRKFAEDIGEREFYVLVKSPLFRLQAIGFLPEVNERTLSISLQPQSPSDSANGVLQFFLPKDEEDSADFLKTVSDTKEQVLSAYLPSLDGIEIHLATSAEVLETVTNDSRPQ